MAATLKEIARATGLSVPTVGNVLGSAGHRHSVETRARVLEAAKRLGYTPNASARAVRSGRFGCIALILSRSKSRTHSFLPFGLLDGIEQELGLHDMHLSVSRLGESEFNSDLVVPKVLRQATADGLIVHYTHELPMAIREAIRRHRAPVVGTNAKLEANCVYPDDYGATRDTTRRLIKMGHRRIVFLQFLPAGPDPTETMSQRLETAHYSVVDRRAGYRDAMREAGLAPRIVEDQVLVPHPEFVAVTDRLLAGDDAPTAVICYSERETNPLVHSALKRGWSIPRDLSVTFFGADHQWTLGTLLTAVLLPVEEMGREAVRMVLRKLNESLAVCPAKALPYRLQDSTPSLRSL